MNTNIELDDLYDTEEDAQEAACDYISECEVGGYELHMSNPGDNEYDESDYDDATYDIEEVDD